MYYPSEKIKVNKFVNTRIPTNAEYFARYGLAVSPSSQYSGDEMAPQSKNKIEQIQDMLAYDKMKQEEENNKSV